MSKRDVVFPPGRQALYERNRYSPAIRSNGFLFVSGQVGSREVGVTWLYGFQFEIKVIAKLPEA